MQALCTNNCCISETMQVYRIPNLLFTTNQSFSDDLLCRLKILSPSKQGIYIKRTGMRLTNRFDPY
ncbi:hypothetical protein [Neisseria sicca]|uniref:hypothetical protein n=1 Tax=Neisseria sicca TaxID=490 RepID=UPI0011BD0AEF|nr:hypothetical protein [Neisseria sicca]